MSGLTALVLAGSRPGRIDPLAAAAGVSHKALIQVAGTPMLRRVLDALLAAPDVDRIVVSAERAEAILAAVDAPAGILAREAAASPSRSVAEVFAEFGPRMLVTTADHALLDPAMIAQVAASPPSSDAMAGLARSGTILAAYPATRRTWLRFADGDFSGCNLFLLNTPQAMAAIRFWQRLEQSRKRPLAMAWLVGPLEAAAYFTRRLTLERALGLLGRRMGVTLAPILMDQAEAAIDVDTPGDLVLAESILAARGFVDACGAGS